MSELDDDHEAWRARTEAAHPGRACFGCRDCDPVPGWHDPEPVGVTGWVRSRWTGTAPTILEDVHAAAEVIRNLPAFPDPPPPDYAVPGELREAIEAAGYYRVDLAMHPATVQTVRELGASRPLYPPEPGHLAGLPPPLGPSVYADPDVPPGVARLRPRRTLEEQ